KKKNQTSKASPAATTLTTTTRSTGLIPYLRRASPSRSSRMLRSQGEVWRAAAGRPVRASYLALIQVSTAASPHTQAASTTITEKTAVRLRLLRLPWTLEPTQTANSGAPVQRLIEQSAEAATRPTFFRAIAG